MNIFEENKLKMSLQLLASNDEEDKNDNLNDEKDDEKDAVKTFTQEEVDRLIAKAKKKAKEKAEADLSKAFEEKMAEEKRLALLSEKERQAEIEKKQRADFEKEKAEFERNKMMFETKKLLVKEGLDEGLASYVVRDTAEETLAEITNMKNIFSKGYEENINNRLKNNAPRKGQGATIDPFLQGFSK